MAKEKNAGTNAGIGKAQTLMERMLKNSTIKAALPLKDSDIYNEQPGVPTKCPMLNLALSGRIDSGVQKAITMLCGGSKNYKSMLALYMVAAYLEKKPNAICLFFDVEFGAKKAYFESCGIDANRVIRIPVTDVEMLSFEVANQLNNINDGDDVIMLLDSLGAIASKKETTNIENQESKQDMTRAKAIKAFFRVITPKLYMKNVPMFIVNHTYKEQGGNSFLPPKDIISGGTGSVYSATNIWIITKNKLKESTIHTGYKFIIKIFKSRDIKEDSVFPLTVRYDGGLAPWSGLCDVAEMLGVIDKCKISRNNGYQYTKLNGEVLQVLESKIDTADEFWQTVLKETDLQYRLENMYLLGRESKDSLNFDTEEADEIIKEQTSELEEETDE